MRGSLQKIKLDTRNECNAPPDEKGPIRKEVILVCCHESHSLKARKESKVAASLTLGLREDERERNLCEEEGGETKTGYVERSGHVAGSAGEGWVWGCDTSS